MKNFVVVLFSFTFHIRMYVKYSWK